MAVFSFSLLMSARLEYFASLIMLADSFPSRKAPPCAKTRSEKTGFPAPKARLTRAVPWQPTTGTDLGNNCGNDFLNKTFKKLCFTRLRKYDHGNIVQGE
jgi:hypothetical protein